MGHVVALKKAWRWWAGIAKHIGDFQARVLLTVVYFLVLLPIAAIVTMVSDPLHLRFDAKPRWTEHANESPSFATTRRQS